MSLSKELVARIEREYSEIVDEYTYYIPGDLVRWIPLLIGEIRRLEAEIIILRINEWAKINEWAR